MDEGDQPNGEFIDLKVDASAYALAAVFGSVAFPPNMPEYLKAAILDRADQARNVAGDLIIDNRMDASDPKSRREREEEADDFVSQWVQNAQQMQADREREEWSRTKSTVGGVTMTGAEWAEISKRLREDDKLREDILDLFRKRGMSQEEAERHYERVIDVAEIAAIPPSQRTEDQQHQFEKAKADPSTSRDIQDVELLIKKDAGSKPAIVQSAENSAIPTRNVVTTAGPVI